MQEIANGILSLNWTGGSCGAVDDYCLRLLRKGLWPRIQDRLRERVCLKVGRRPTPGAATVDCVSCGMSANEKAPLARPL